MLKTVISAIAISVLQVLPAVAQDSDTILILDESGSMWAQLPEGRSRIEVARDVLGEFMTSRDASAPLGVIAYGHNRRGDCSDIETITPVELQDGAALSAQLRALMPRGKTPLADSLRRAVAEIRPTSEAVNIVLLTDGMETCGGDPCSVAAELAAKGIDIRAHIVGFGLTEGEVAQIACVADLTGGMVLAPQNGQELADALIRTTEPVLRDAELPGAAALNLTITADIAGRPDMVMFSAKNLSSGEEFDLGNLDFATASSLATDLAEGRWMIRADAGEQGRGEAEIEVLAGDNRTIYVPFTGLLPGLDLPVPAGDFRAGINGLLPYRITREGLATGGGDFVISVLPVDAANTDDRRLDYSTQEPRLGGHVAQFRTPTEAGQYLIAFHRNAAQDIGDVMQSFVINVVERPVVTLAAPAAVEPGARVPVQISTGLGNYDRIEIWRDGALYSWDQSIYVQDFFDNRYGPAQPLTAPAEPGEYEIVYVFSELDGPDSVAARLPLTVGAGAELEEAALDLVSDPLVQEAALQEEVMGDDIGYGCDQAICMITDAATGLSFALPQGWVADLPTLEAYTAGGAAGTPRVTFMRESDDQIDTIVLNPRQWVAMNGPCLDVPAGQLCQFEGEGADPAVAALLAQTLRWDASAAQDADSGHAPDDDPLRAQAAFVCDTDFIGCNYQNDPMQFFTMVPIDWSITEPVRAAEPGADGRKPLRVTYFSKMEVPDRIELNPEGWTDADGPCVSVQAGALCHAAEASDRLTPAMDLITRTVRDTAPRNIPTQQEAMAQIMADLAEENPDAAAAMGALLGAAQDMTQNEGEVPDAGDMMGAVIGTLFNAQDPAQPSPPPTPLDSTASSGVVLKTCGNDGPCVFEQPALAISGALPAGWQVEVAVQRPDLRISTWFTHRDPAGNTKRMGLNQPDNDTCIDTALGRLCQYTPYISTQEERLIARSLGYGLASDVAARLGVTMETPQPLDDTALDGLRQLIEGN